MLSKKNRVSRHLFPVIITKGKNYYSPNMYIRVAKPGFSFCSPASSEQNKQITKSKNFPCFSVVVSKKVSKKAVERNKFRRRIYGIVQKNIPDIQDGVLVAFFIKKSATAISKKEFTEETISLLKKAGLFKNKTN